MSKLVRVKLFDFVNSDQNYNKRFRREDVEDFLKDHKTRQDLKNGKFTALASHRSRIIDDSDPLYNSISYKDCALINRDIAGIIKDIFIKGNDVLADIKLLPNSEYGRLINDLIDCDVKVGISVSFLDSSDMNDEFYQIYEFMGADFTLDQAFKTSEIIGILK